ncbi:MAG: LmeA family phospholipid-binding protein [Microcoleus sp.]
MDVDRNFSQFDSEPAGVGGEEDASSRGTRIASKILSPAVRLWLRSQVERVDELKVTIEGSDRQLFGGKIPKVTVAAAGAVYMGLHLTEVALCGAKIRVNLGQVLKGQPLRLLESIPVTGVLRLSQADLNESLKAPLLADALSEFLLPMLPIGDREKPLKLENSQVTIDAGLLTLSAVIAGVGGAQIPLVLRTGLQIANGRELIFESPEIELDRQLLNASNFNDFKIDFGSEVNIEELTLSPGEIVCRGGITVLP